MDTDTDTADWSPDDGGHYRAGYELGQLEQDQARESFRDGQGAQATGRGGRWRWSIWGSRTR